MKQKESTKKYDIEVSKLLPTIHHEKDKCVQRLLGKLRDICGIETAHLKQINETSYFCFEYDPDLISFNQIQVIAKEEGAALTKTYHHDSFHITDMDCGDCATSIEHILRRIYGIMDVSVSYSAELMRVEYDANVLNREKIKRQVQALGYNVEEKDTELSWYLKNRMLLLSLTSGLFLLIGVLCEWLLGLPRSAILPFYVLSYVTGGWDAANHGVKASLRFQFDIDFLMIVAAAGAAALGEWPEGAFLLFLFSLGHALEHYATDKARNAISALGKITPQNAWVKRDGEDFELPVEKLERGDTVIVKPGERMPIDGKILNGVSYVNESPITGESVPVQKYSGEPVFAGTINGDGALEIEVTKLSKDTTLSRVIELVEEAQTQKSPTQQLTQKFQRIFVPIILALVLLVIFLPPLWGLLGWKEAFLRAMAILVSASPCALAIATPSAVLSAIARSAMSGVLIKGGAHLEKLGLVKVVALDKTGTITEGKMVVTDVITSEDTDPNELLKVAAAVESRSNHVIANAILDKAAENGVTISSAEDVQTVVGKGVTALFEGKNVTVGNLKLFGDDLPQTLKEKVLSVENEGKTTIVVQYGEDFLGCIALADLPRENARNSLQKLKKIGIQLLVMITGDNEKVARAISEQVGIDEVHAGLLPEQKVEVIKDLLEKHENVAMVGDGVNDAPALHAATLGIAMGASGTDVALETADVALMSDDLSKLPLAVGLSRRSRRVIKQNLYISLGVILFLVPAALFGFANIGVAIVFHEGSTLFVAFNALRLLKHIPADGV